MQLTARSCFVAQHRVSFASAYGGQLETQQYKRQNAPSPHLAVVTNPYIMSDKKTRRESPAVNAGSMADIAFLLLIFFLVTTTIQEDQGVLVRLPDWSNDPPPPQQTLDENVLTVLINTDDKLLIEEENAEIRDIPGLIREHVISPKRAPNEAVISLTHDRGTSYATYLQVYDALKAGYRSLWDDKSNERYGKIYAHLSQAEQKSIRNEIPMIISEAEPSDYEE